MTAPLLALLTESWPFPSARDGVFIAPELPFLLRRFPQVVVLPRYPDSGAEAQARATLAAACQGSVGEVRLDLRLSVHRRSLPALALAGVRSLPPWPRSDLGPAGPAAQLLRWRHRTWARIMADRLADLVDGHGGPAVLYSYWFHLQAVAAGCLAARRPDVRAVTRAHGADLYEERSPGGYIPLRRAAMRNLSRIICVSRHGADYLANRHPGSSGRIAVHRLATANSSSEGPEPSAEGEVVLASCSYLVPLKRVPRIAAIAAGVAQALGRTVRWVHFGGGEEAGLVADAVRDKPGLVAELPGDVAHATVLACYRTRPIHLFLNQSTTEGVPVSVMEALGSGIPVVATAAGGTAEILAGGAGIIHPIDEPVASVVAQISRLLLDRPAYRAARSAARSQWERSCRAEAVFPPFVDELRGLI